MKKRNRIRLTHYPDHDDYLVATGYYEDYITELRKMSSDYKPRSAPWYKENQIKEEHWKIWSDEKQQYIFHRVNGPAIKSYNGGCFNRGGEFCYEYYLNGEERPEMGPWLKEYGLYEKSYKKWSNEMKVLFRMTF